MTIEPQVITWPWEPRSWTTRVSGLLETLDHRNQSFGNFWPSMALFLAQFDTVWRSWRESIRTHRRLGHVPPLSDVLAVLLVRHADPLFGHHLLSWWLEVFWVSGSIRGFSSLCLELDLVLVLMERLRELLSCLRTQKDQAPPLTSAVFPCTLTWSYRASLANFRIYSFKLKYPCCSTFLLHFFKMDLGGQSAPIHAGIQ